MVQVKVVNKVTNFISSEILEIYEQAFPLSERRITNKLNDFWKSSALLTYNLIFEQHEEVGFLFHWNMGNYIFLEHFAINQNFREKGIGKEAFAQWLKQNPSPTHLLEVEPPINPTCLRRIKFYESFGFRLLNINYIQPSYHEGGSPVEMRLMVKSEIDISPRIEWYRDQIYKVVYDIDEIS